MAPRSPTQTFDPTPALEQNPTNYSPLNDSKAMLAFDTYASEVHKGVRFSEPPTAPIYRAHSIATENVPLLPPIASASVVPKTAFRITNPTPGIDITAYIENCRNLNEQLRQAHDAERKAWNIERTALKSKIADLEFCLNKANDMRRRASNDTQPHHIHSALKSDIRALYQSNKSNLHKPVSDSIIPTVAPVWKGPESTPPTTRVFQTEDTNGHHLPSISEDEAFPSLSKEVSPGTVVENEPISVEKIDSTLDGITLRSAGLTSSFEAKITSPQFGSPMRSPLSDPTEPKSNGNILHIDASTLLSPLDEKLKRHAGHTPMALPGDHSSNIASGQSTEIPTPMAEKPPAPAPTTRPPLRPMENSDSYFSTVSDSDVISAVPESMEKQTLEGEGESEPQSQFEPEEDRALRGPLMLDTSARSKAATAFLDQLDAKLEAVREASPDRRQSYVSVSSNGDSVAEPPAQEQHPEPKADVDDDMPRLKMRKSTNFGSAYGFGMPGRM